VQDVREMYHQSKMEVWSSDLFITFY